MPQRKRQPQLCKTCSQLFQPRARGGDYCSRLCAMTARKTPEKLCSMCGRMFHAKHGSISQHCCSRSCARRYVWQQNPGRMLLNIQKARASQNTQAILAKREAWQHSPNNPIYNPIVRQKALITQREKGYQRLTGGNGAITVPQRLLALRLGWQTEVTVCTNQLGTTGKKIRPYKYTIDVAHEMLKIAIEINGHSHQAPAIKLRDAKKDACLVAQGWKVLRFTNKAILTDLETVAQVILNTVKSLTLKL